MNTCFSYVIEIDLTLSVSRNIGRRVRSEFHVMYSMWLLIVCMLVFNCETYTHRPYNLHIHVQVRCHIKFLKSVMFCAASHIKLSLSFSHCSVYFIVILIFRQSHK